MFSCHPAPASHQPKTPTQNPVRLNVLQICTKSHIKSVRIDMKWVKQHIQLENNQDWCLSLGIGLAWEKCSVYDRIQKESCFWNGASYHKPLHKTYIVH